MLSGGLLGKLNPVKIAIRNIKDMPGIQVTSLATRHYVDPSPFKLLEQYAYPPYCIVRMFTGDREICSRVTRTKSVAQCPNANFDFVTAYLTGHLDRQLLMECVETMPVKIELQDRQPVPTKEDLREAVIKYEMLLAGGHAIPKNPDDDGNTNKDKETKPIDIFDVDETRLIDMHESWKTVGDGCSHGIMSCGLGLLLDQSAQLASAYNLNNFDKKSKDKPHPPRNPFLKMRLDVLQEKRRRIPIGGLDEWQLNEGELLIRKTGNYLSMSEVPLQHADMHLNHRSSTTSVGVRIDLTEPILSLEEGDAERTGNPDDIIFRPFTRAVYTFEYKNVKLLQVRVYESRA